jgi:uncharacterized protein YqgV (UPF0045/DUF77 family)
MKVQAQVSIYPLKTESLSLPVDEFCRILRSNGVEVRKEAMSSFITGKSEVIFRSVRQAFEALAHKHDLVIDFKVSNSCPENIANNDLTKEQR